MGNLINFKKSQIKISQAPLPSVSKSPIPINMEASQNDNRANDKHKNANVYFMI